MARMYQPPDYYRPTGTARLVDLMLRRGDIQAQGAERSGQIWGGAVRGLGQIASGAFEQHAEQKAQEREAVAKRQRETDFVQGLQAGDMDRNKAMEIFGPKDGLMMWNAVEASEQMAQKQGAEAMGHLKDILVPFVGMSPETQKMIYPQLRGLAINSKIVPPDQIPEQLTPEFSEVLSNMAHQLNPKEKVNPVEVNGQLVDPTTGNVIGDYRNAEKPPTEADEIARLMKTGMTWTEAKKKIALETRLDPQRDPLVQELARERLEAMQRDNAGTNIPAFADLSPERRTAIDFVTNSLSKDKKRSWLDTITRAVKSGDDEALRTSVRLAAYASESVDAKKTVLGRVAMIAALKEAGKVLVELKDAGVDTNILRGTAEDVAARLGTTTDPKLKSLATRLRNNIILYRQAVSGAAFSVQESLDYEKVNPSYKNTFEVNEAVIDGMIQSLDVYDRVYWEEKVGPAASWVREAGPQGAPLKYGTTVPGPSRAGAKSASTSDVQAFATQNRVSYAEAEAHFKKYGITIK